MKNEIVSNLVENFLQEEEILNEGWLGGIMIQL